MDKMNTFTVLLFDKIYKWEIAQSSPSELLKLQTTYLGASTDSSLSSILDSPWMNSFPLLRRTQGTVQIDYIIMPSAIPCLYDNLKATNGKFVLFKLVKDTEKTAHISSFDESDITFVTDYITTTREFMSVRHNQLELERIANENSLTYEPSHELLGNFALFLQDFANMQDRNIDDLIVSIFS